jgi:hypothetical protein
MEFKSDSTGETQMKMITKTYDGLGHTHSSKVEMSDEQVRNYTLYRKACKINGVEPVLADFLAGDIPSCVSGEPQRSMVVCAGR